jgi:hypothetical protein
MTDHVDVVAVALPSFHWRELQEINGAGSIGAKFEAGATPNGLQLSSPQNRDRPRYARSR